MEMSSNEINPSAFKKARTPTQFFTTRSAFNKNRVTLLKNLWLLCYLA